MNGQKIYFDANGRLVVETNKGVIRNDGKDLEVPVDGYFEVDSSTVAKLLAHFNKSTWKGSTWSGFYNSIITTQEEIQKIIDDEPFRAKYHSERATTAECQLEAIKKKIREFNKSRRFYERKFEL